MTSTVTVGIIRMDLATREWASVGSFEVTPPAGDTADEVITWRQSTMAPVLRQYLADNAIATGDYVASVHGLGHSAYYTTWVAEHDPTQTRRVHVGFNYVGTRLYSHVEGMPCDRCKHRLQPGCCEDEWTHSNMLGPTCRKALEHARGDARLRAKTRRGKVVTVEVPDTGDLTQMQIAARELADQAVKRSDHD